MFQESRCTLEFTRIYFCFILKRVCSNNSSVGDNPNHLLDTLYGCIICRFMMDNISSSGKSFLMSMELTQLAHIMEHLNSSLSASMFTIMKLPVESMSPELSWWILSLALWTVSGVDLLDRSSDLTTSCSVKAEQETIGQRDITLRVSCHAMLDC